MTDKEQAEGNKKQNIFQFRNKRLPVEKNIFANKAIKSHKKPPRPKYLKL